ncbi:ABC transporter permease [Bifidobacterium aquikefiricola]|uniref:ABC transporter permease n=1 Tax=Bifidobacterium aquikefiricola TaxID=3059038 RepID=A0AB39U610_9BIFI
MNSEKESGKRNSLATLMGKMDKSLLLLIVLTLIVLVAFSVASPDFLTLTNMRNIAVQVAPEAIVAVAMTFVITAGMIDLSVGSILALTTVVSALILKTSVDSSVGIIAGIAVGALCGVINGWFSSYQKMPSFIVTLATMSALRGVALLITLGYSIPIAAGRWFTHIGQGRFLGMGIPAWSALVVAVIGMVGLHNMRFGEYITGIGSNEESVRRAGVNTNGMKMLALTLSGAAAGLAGVITAARLGTGDANSATDFSMTVITAVVIGGTDLLGGKGSVLGSLIGAILLGMITDGLTLLNLSPYIIPVVTGVLLLTVIWANLHGVSVAQFVKRRMQS